MASVIKYNCPCFKCNLKPCTLRTIQDHFKQNLAHIEHLRTTGAQQDLVDFVEGCQYNLSLLIQTWKVSSLLCDLLINYLLICFDLADASMGLSSPQHRMSDGDPMAVDDDADDGE